MAEIRLSFTPEMASAIISGKKICTTRPEQKGNPGDEFVINDTAAYRIIDVVTFPLWEIACRMYRLEGFESEEDFIRAWNSIPGYPKFRDVTFVPYYVHFFAPAPQEVA